MLAFNGRKGKLRPGRYQTAGRRPARGFPAFSFPSAIILSALHALDSPQHAHDLAAPLVAGAGPAHHLVGSIRLLFRLWLRLEGVPVHQPAFGADPGVGRDLDLAAGGLAGRRAAAVDGRGPDPARGPVRQGADGPERTRRPCPRPARRFRRFGPLRGPSPARLRRAAHGLDPAGRGRRRPLLLTPRAARGVFDRLEDR